MKSKDRHSVNITPRDATIAKISPPVISGIFQRKRLFNKFDSLRKSRRSVIWISALAGSGKTTLVSSYLDARRLPCLWYQVDEGDADIASFFYYMSKAAKKAAPRKRRPMPLLTPEYMYGLPTFIRHYFHELYQRLKASSVIVFDSYQEVSETSEFHDAIRAGLSILPGNMNVIIISRCDPPPQLAYLQVANTAEIIGSNDLRLTWEESVGIARVRGCNGLSEENIKRIQNQVQGWAAGLVLALESAKAEGIKSKAAGVLSPENIFKYFAGEIFGKVDKSERDFLLKTALLPRMTVKMAEKISGHSRAGSILSELKRNNYFIERRSQPEFVYQYHPLFRDFLLSQTRDIYSKSRFAHLQGSAAKLLVDSGQIEDAAALFIEVGEWQDLAQLIKTAAKQLIAQGRHTTLKKWFMGIPGKTLAEDPWLLYWLGICLLPFDPSQSQAHFEGAFDLFRSRRDSAGIYLALSGALDAVFYECKNFGSYDQWIAILDEVQREYPDFPSREIEDIAIPSIFLALTVRQPDHPQFAYWHKQTRLLLEKSSEPNLRVSAGQNLGMYYYWAGDFSNVSILIELLRGLAKPSRVFPLLEIMVKMLETFHAWLTNQPERCLKAIHEYMEMAKTTGIHIWDFHFLGAGAAISLTSGNLIEAERFLAQMESCLPEGRILDIALYYVMTSWLDFSKGDLHQARLHCERHLKLAEEFGATLPLAVGHYAMSQIWHESGKHQKAAHHLKEAFGVARRMRSGMIEFMCLLAEAHYAFDRGEQDRALKSLSKAMSLGREKDYVNFFLFRPDVMAQLSARALEAGIEVEYVRSLIARRGLVPETPPVELEEWPWQLRIYTLGRFELQISGEPLKFTAKVPEKPLEMLKALIAYGGQDVAKENIMDALWPDSDGDAAHTAFSTNLQRLRELLDIGEAINLSGGGLSLNSRYCWVDVFSFERILSQVDMAGRKKGKRKGDTEQLEKAMELYRGTFLEKDSHKPWSVPFRERLRDRFIWCVNELGMRYDQAGDWEKAIECYRKGLEAEELAEEFYYNQMNRYIRLGQPARAIEVYRRCRAIFSSVLGEEPSPRTKALYKTILSP